MNVKYVIGTFKSTGEVGAIIFPKYGNGEEVFREDSITSKGMVYIDLDVRNTGAVKIIITVDEEYKGNNIDNGMDYVLEALGQHRSMFNTKTR